MVALRRMKGGDSKEHVVREKMKTLVCNRMIQREAAAFSWKGRDIVLKVAAGYRSPEANMLDVELIADDQPSW